MVTIYKVEENKYLDDNNMEVELRGLSTDTKPTTIKGSPIGNGSVFIEIDTGKIFMYDLTNQEWNEV
jgi:hypothetical protein